CVFIISESYSFVPTSYIISLNVLLDSLSFICSHFVSPCSLL
ncbi:hypothetical protein HID58_077180, partial [Brassica napus]